MKLYTYFRSSASYRVRIAMNLKGIQYHSEGVSLLDASHKSATYLQTNPQGLLPALELGDGSVIAQSTAILEYLEETHPDPALLPADPLQRSRVRSLANHIACDIHPLNNLRVLHYLRDEMNADQPQLDQWYAQWVQRGFAAIETVLQEGNGHVCFGERPGLADCYLIPQVYNALRFKVDLGQYSAIQGVYDHCNTLQAFQMAHPDRQADKPGE